jgi:hypothetical protein
MKPQQKYLSAQSMRVALEDRLNRMAKDNSADIMRAETCGIPDDLSFAIDKIRQFYKKLTAL